MSRFTVLLALVVYMALGNICLRQVAFAAPVENAAGGLEYMTPVSLQYCPILKKHVEISRHQSPCDDGKCITARTVAVGLAADAQVPMPTESPIFPRHISEPVGRTAMHIRERWEPPPLGTLLASVVLLV